MNNKELTYQEIANTFEKYQKNPASYFHALKSGTISVKLEDILLAQKFFGLDPSILFKPLEVNVIEEESTLLSKGEDVQENKAEVPIGFLATSILKQQAILEVLLADKAEEVSTALRKPLAEVSSEYESHVNERLKVIQRQLKSRIH